jgi:MFS family permease
VSEATSERPRLLTPTFLLIAAASLAYFTSAGITLPAVPRFVAGPLGGSNVEVGIAVSVFAFAALAARPFVARMGDRRGRRPLMIVGGLLVGLSIAAYGVAGSVVSMTVFRVVSGVGEAFFFTGASIAIADLAPEERRGEAVSFFSLALYIGIGVGPLFGELLVDGLGYGWTWAVGALLAGVAGVIAIVIPETRPDSVAQAPGRTRLIHPAAILPGSVLLASVSAQAGFLSFVPLYTATLGLSGSRFVFILYSGIVVLIRSVGARIPDRIGPVRASRLALSFTLIGMVVAGVWRSPAGLFVGTGVFAIGSALAFPALITLALRGSGPEDRASVMATTGGFVDLAFGVGPALLGVVSEVGGYGGLFLTAALIAAAGLSVLLLAYRRSTGRR